MLARDVRKDSFRLLLDFLLLIVWHLADAHDIPYKLYFMLDS